MTTSLDQTNDRRFRKAPNPISIHSASLAAQWLRWKVRGHLLLRRARRAFAGLARHLPGAWSFLHLPRFRIRCLSSWVREQREARLDWWERRSGPFLEQLHDSVIIKRKPPRSIHYEVPHGAFTLERHHIYEPIYLAVLPSAHVFGPNGVVVTPDGGLIEESTWGRGHLDNEPVSLVYRLPPAERLAGRYYTIAGVGGSGYYHWFADVLPRLMAWEGLHADDVKLIINTPIDDWKRESLDLLDLGNAPIVHLGHRHLELELLYFPSYVGAPSPHPAGCRWLRQRLLPTEIPDRGKRRLYISRSKAKTRRLLNEPDLVPVLESFGFEIIHAEDLSLAEQIRRFSEAEAIVAPHGAGLTNMLWAPPSCRILEIFEPTYVHVMYYLSAEILKQQYWYLIGKGAGKQEPQHLTTGFDDILVDKDELSRALSAMLRPTG